MDTLQYQFPTRLREKRKDWPSLLSFVGLCLGVGFLGSAMTMNELPSWYASLKRPLLAPPDSAFGPVWTLLYIMMGVSAWYIFARRWDRPTEVRYALGWFAAQLGLNFLWTYIFFQLHAMGLAALELVLLIGAILQTIRLFLEIDLRAAALLLPYMAWTCFAFYLNFYFWILNK